MSEEEMNIDYKEFFFRYGDCDIQDCVNEFFTINNLAQAIEDRIMERVLNLKADVQGVYSQADLIDAKESPDNRAK